MIIHSDAAEATRQNDKKEQGEEASSENDKFFLHPRFAEGLSDPYAGPADFFEKKKPFGFMVRSTKNGSMTQERFMDYCIHHVKNLPVGQGKGGLPSFIFLMGTPPAGMCQHYDT